MREQSIIKFTLGENKKSGLFLTTLLSAFTGGGSLYLSHFLDFGNGRGVLLILGLCSLAITLFCAIAYYKLKREGFTALFISDEGINDISTGNRIGTVMWKDVECIKIMDDISNLKHKYIVLKVHNPEVYISREPTRSKRRSLNLKLQFYGSPICFSNRALNCTFEELEKAVTEKYNLYKRNHPDSIHQG